MIFFGVKIIVFAVLRSRIVFHDKLSRHKFVSTKTTHKVLSEYLPMSETDISFSIKFADIIFLSIGFDRFQGKTYTSIKLTR